MNRIQKIVCVFALLTFATTFGAFTPETAHGDDRDLFRSSSDAPYIFILFDVTGSMARRTDGVFPPLFEDSVDSKMFVAKDALYTVLDETTGVNFGFATFPNQDRLRITNKATPGGCDNAPYGGGGDPPYELPQSDFTCDTITPRDRNQRDTYCAGLETNGDSAQDNFFDNNSGQGLNIKFPTTTTATGLEIGDLVPLDWGSDNVEILKQRLAPNLIANPDAMPDFGVADYFEDDNTGGRNFHRLIDNEQRPFMAVGLTPLAGALGGFRDWYEDWEDDAIAADPEFECREVFVLLMTDGLETCVGENEATDEAADLLAATGVETYVVGFATDNPRLNDIAEAGDPDGERQAFSAETSDELVDVFNQILDSIRGQAKSFSAAAVPSLQSAAGRNVFLSSFNPATGAPVWPGRLDSYVVPVPFVTTPDGTVVADRRNSAKCTNADDIDEEGCWAWFASEELLVQAPSDIDPITASLTEYKFGLAANQRRVFYAADQPTDDIPADRKCFLPASIAATANSQLCDPDTGDDTDLYGPTGMDLDDPTEWDTVGKEIFADLFAHRTTEIVNLEGDEEDVDYVLGDIFHSQPTVTAAPNDNLYLAESLGGRVEICGPRLDGRPDIYKEPYACFADKHQWRRRLVVAGSNDGQLHFFDGGRPVDDLVEDPFGNPIVTFTSGTGREVFSFVPRYLLPKLAETPTRAEQAFGVDGAVTLGDVGIDPVHDGTPSADDREWRSIVVGGLREGGRSYYALDITQPDQLDTENRLDPYVDSTPSCILGAAGCDYPFPMVLWELTDDWDEDKNGAPDMGFTWSKPRIERIRFDDGTEIVDKFVAVFGGGFDPEFKDNPINDNGTPDDTSDDESNPWSGNYVYMVDIETGKIIYKRRMDVVAGDGTVLSPAMIPSEIATADTDFDSYIDTIYFGTTAGVMYKIDISDAEELATFDVEDWSEADLSDPDATPITRSVDRIPPGTWDPFPVFQTGGRPIYYPPSVVFFSELNQYAIAFGTGDREDLWNITAQEGRFYFLLDQNWVSTDSNLPFDETDYTVIGLNAPNAGSDVDYITDPINGNEPGWILRLTTEERVTERSLVIAGVVFFNSFVPQPFVPSDGLCAQEGFSQVFAVFTSNADGLFVDPDDPDADGDRFQTIEDFATSPYIQLSAIEDELPDDASGQQSPPEDDLSPAQEAIRDRLKDLQPDNCRFANYTVNVSVNTTESGSYIVAPVPVCVIERNFRQF